jgi:hypothetical protein
MLMLLVIGSLGVAHYLLAKFPLMLLAAIPVQLLIIYFMLKSYRKTAWGEITL